MNKQYWKDTAPLLLLLLLLLFISQSKFLNIRTALLRQNSAEEDPEILFSKWLPSCVHYAIYFTGWRGAMVRSSTNEKFKESHAYARHQPGGKARPAGRGMWRFSTSLCLLLTLSRLSENRPSRPPTKSRSSCSSSSMVRGLRGPWGLSNAQVLFRCHSSVGESKISRWKNSRSVPNMYTQHVSVC